MPTTIPAAAKTNPCRAIITSICERLAPTAIRRPISCVRRTAACAATLYSPTTASNSASPANAESKYM